MQLVTLVVELVERLKLPLHIAQVFGAEQYSQFDTVQKVQVLLKRVLLAAQVVHVVLLQFVQLVAQLVQAETFPPKE